MYDGATTSNRRSSSNKVEGVGHQTERTDNCSRHAGEITGHLHNRQVMHNGRKEANKDDRVLGRPDDNRPP